MAEIKLRVIEDYSAIANFATLQGSAKQRETICKAIYSPISTLYTETPGYIAEADLGLGCGFPFIFIPITKGMVGADLGCASGIDSFILSELVGNSGNIFGFDITPKLIERAQSIADTNGIDNINFVSADIENLPLENNSVDFITSNGVFSLLPDKLKVISEMFRVLKAGGNFAIADIVQQGPFSPKLQDALYHFTGCLNGISEAQMYLNTFKAVGFNDVKIVGKRKIEIPDEVVAGQAQVVEVEGLKTDAIGLFIITITGNKPLN